MARSDRLFRLLQTMRELPKPVTAARLAVETGVSLRSLYRDIDSLRAAGARIEGERGYGYTLTEDYALPPQTLDRTEIEALALGLAEVLHMGDPALANAATAVLAKVAATLPDEGERHLFHAVSKVRRLEPRYPPAPELATIRQGCWREEAVRIHYADRVGKNTDRTILPLAISYLDRRLVVLAWCCLREGFRVFYADRISEARLAGITFRPRRVTLLRAHLAELKGRDGQSPGSVQSSSARDDKAKQVASSGEPQRRRERSYAGHAIRAQRTTLNACREPLPEALAGKETKGRTNG